MNKVTELKGKLSYYKRQAYLALTSNEVIYYDNMVKETEKKIVEVCPSNYHTRFIVGVGCPTCGL